MKLLFDERATIKSNYTSEELDMSVAVSVKEGSVELVIWDGGDEKGRVVFTLEEFDRIGVFVEEFRGEEDENHEP